MLGFAKKFFGSSNDRKVKAFMARVAAINALEPKYRRRCRDDELRMQDRTSSATGSPRARRLDKILNEAFAVVREASKRVLGQRHYDVQLVGGMILHDGGIAEMRTGEGKTLVATAPVYLNALAGKGVHVITVNDYLARRDAEWMGRVYRFLGMSVGRHRPRPVARASARRPTPPTSPTAPTTSSASTICATTWSMTASEMVQRGHNFAIVDEVELHPDRRGAHAADHLGPDRGPLRALPDHRRAS